MVTPTRMVKLRRDGVWLTCLLTWRPFAELNLAKLLPFFFGFGVRTTMAGAVAGSPTGTFEDTICASWSAGFGPSGKPRDAESQGWLWDGWWVGSVVAIVDLVGSFGYTYRWLPWWCIVEPHGTRFQRLLFDRNFVFWFSSQPEVLVTSGNFRFT